MSDYLPINSGSGTPKTPTSKPVAPTPGNPYGISVTDMSKAYRAITPKPSAGKTSGKTSVTPKYDAKTQALLNANKQAGENISAGQAVLNSFFTPVNFFEDLTYRTIHNFKNQKYVDSLNSKFAKDPLSYFSWLGDQWATSAANATAWARNEPVKHTGGAIAKELGLITPVKKSAFTTPKLSSDGNLLQDIATSTVQGITDAAKGIVSGKSDFWTEVKNIAVSTAIDAALDPFSYTPAAPVFAVLKGVSKGGAAALRNGVKAAAGDTLESIATKRLTAEELQAAKKTVVSPRGKVIIKPENLPGPSALQATKDVAARYDAKLARQKSTLVTLPNAIDRTIGQKALDVIAVSAKTGTDALRATLTANAANTVLSKAARQAIKTGKKAASDYVYEAGKATEQAAAHGVNVPETIVPKPNEVKIEQPKTGVAFPEKAPSAFEAVMSSVSKKDIKQISSDLSYVNNIAKKVVGIKPGSKILSENVQRFIAGVDGQSGTIFNALKPQEQKALREAVSLKDYNPKLFFEEQLARAKSGSAASRAFANSYGNRVAQFTTGNEKIGAFLVKNADVPFTKLTVTDRKILIDALNSFTNGTDAGLAEKLVNLVGDKTVAQQLIDAGALNGTSADVPAIKKILDGLPASEGTKVGYGSVDELYAGINAGDIVNGDSLLKILKRLDPQHSMIAKIEKAATKPSSQMMAEILKGSGVPQTLAEMRSRIAMADTPVFMQATGLSNYQAVAAVLDASLLGKFVPTPEIFAASREYAQQAVARMSTQDIKDEAIFLNETWGQRFQQDVDILARKEAEQRVSQLGDVATIGATKAYTGADAMLSQQTNASWQAILVAKMLGANTARAALKTAKMTSEALSEFDKTAWKMDKFVLRMARMREIMLATTGSRMFVQSTEKLSRESGKHIALIDMGDIVRTFRKTPEGTDVITRAFFIDGEGYAKQDSLEIVSMLNVAQKILQARDLKSPLILEDLIKTAIRREGKTKLSKKYAAELQKNAEDFVNYLKDFAAPDLETIHLDRASAAATDFTQRSMDLNGQIVDAMKSAWKLANEAGKATPEERFAQVKDLFLRFSYMADVMRNTDGSVAEAVMRAASMVFVKNGKLATGVADGMNEYFKLFPEAGTEDYAKLMEVINSYARLDNPHLAAPTGREGLKRPTAEFINSTEVAMREIKDAIEAHVVAGTKLTSKTALTEWRKTARTLLAKLQSVRKDAWNAWLPIEHWSNIESKFVPVEQFDFKAEQAWAKQHPARLVGDALENTAKDVVDAAPEAFKGAGDGAVKAANRAAKNVAIAKNAVEQITVMNEDAYAKLFSEVEQISQQVGDPGETAILLSERMGEDAFHKLQPETYLYSPIRDKGFGKVEGLTTAEKIMERTSSTGARSDVARYGQIVESQLHTYRSDLARVVHKIYRTYKDVPLEDFSRIWDAAMRGAAVNPEETPLLQNFHMQLSSLIDYIFRDAEVNKINSTAIKNALNHYGLTAELGFTAKDDLKEILVNAPFGKNPYPDGTAEAIQWAQRSEEFIKTGMHPLTAIIKFGSAIQHVKTWQNLAASLTANVGYKAAGMTYKQAIEAGFVALKSTKNSQLLEVMAGAEDGALFHPIIAQQIAALDREMNKLMQGMDYPKYLRSMMEATSLLKATQTILTPRHHIGNTLGEFSIELLRGHMNPVLWKMALDITHEWAKMTWKSEYRGDPLAIINRFVGSLGTDEHTLADIARYTKNGKRIFSASINGKQRELPATKLLSVFTNSNIATNSIFNDQLMSLYEHMISDQTASGSAKQLQKSILARTKLSIDSGLKPFGDFAALYTNVARIAGALHIMASRDWKSEAEMFAAVAKHTHLYHPTISSLGAGERKYGRLLFGYYTWQRVSHSAFIDMALNHTAGITAVPKLLNNIRQQQGIEQQSPGNPWAEGTNVPLNMAGSVYGPLFMTDEGPMGIKTSTMTSDIMDQWQWYVNTGLNADQQFGENWKIGWTYLLGNSNPIVKQFAQEMIGTNLSTGQPLYDRSASAIAGRAFETLGPVQLLESLGAYAPKGKDYTQQQKDLKGLKYFSGLKQFVTNDPGIQKAANKEHAARLKMIVDNINKGMK